MPRRKYKIEKGIPIAPSRTVEGRLPGLSDALARMNEGDSIYIPAKGMSVWQAVYYKARKMNMKVVLRSDGEGTRCWVVIKNFLKAIEDAKRGISHPGLSIIQGLPKAYRRKGR